jgi:hypothetical protein
MKKHTVCILSFIFLVSLTGINAQVGRVGINTTTPSAMFHVKDSAVVFTGPQPIIFNAAHPPVSGSGTRMMWYADKAAFRTGEVSGPNWDRDSIGFYSFASGYDSKAKGDASISMGSYSQANGNQSFAIGNGAQANGDYSISIGPVTRALGANAVSIGTGTIASGYSSTAIGSSADALGQYSTCIGEQSEATGSYAVALGGFARARGLGSFAVQFNTAAGLQSVALGNATNAIGDHSTAIGYVTKATGIASTSLGNTTNARAYGSLSIGQFNDSISTSSTTAWIDTDPVFIIGNGTGNNSRNNAITVLKNAKTGINTSSPEAMLHLVKGTPSGGSFHSNAVMIIESNTNSYIHFSNPVASESGILSGNNLLSIRSGVVFSADSAVQLRTGGNNTRMFIQKDGRIGIRNTDPLAGLDIKGFDATDNRHIRLESNSTTDAANIFYNGDLIFKNNRSSGDFYFQGSTGTNLVSIFNSGNVQVAGELNRPSTSNANLVPICYGSFTPNSTINSGTGNFSITRITSGVYQITITGETYTSTGYTCSISAVSSNAIITTTTSTAGKLQVNSFNQSGVAVDTEFHFTVFKQ